MRPSASDQPANLSRSCDRHAEQLGDHDDRQRTGHTPSRRRAAPVDLGEQLVDQGSHTRAASSRPPGVNALSQPRSRVWSGRVGEQHELLAAEQLAGWCRLDSSSSAYLGREPSMLQLVVAQHGDAVLVPGTKSCRRRRARPVPAHACAGTRDTGRPRYSGAKGVNTAAYRRPMNFIAGRWVPARSGRTMEDRNPADADDLLGDVARSDAGRHRRRRRRRQGRLPRVGGHADAQAGRHHPPRRRADRRTQGRARRPHDPRDGQDPQRGARRRPGGHRLRVLHVRPVACPDG